MKRLIVAFGFPLLLVSTSQAVLVDFDNFDYADGSSLIDSPKWANHSGTSGDLLVSGGEAVVQHGTPSEDANLAFSTLTSGSVYFGLTFSVDDLGAPYSGTDNEYFAHFKDSGFGFVGRVDIVAPGSSGDFSVGIASFSSTADATWGSDLTFDSDYRLVVKYDIDADQAQLWINPTAESDTSILGAAGTQPTSVEAFALRQSDSSENETLRVDGLVIGTTFNDTIAAVPEPSSFLLGGLVCSVLVVNIARRRMQVAV